MHARKQDQPITVQLMMVNQDLKSSTCSGSQHLLDVQPAPVERFRNRQDVKGLLYPEPYGLHSKQEVGHNGYDDRGCP